MAYTENQKVTTNSKVVHIMAPGEANTWKSRAICGIRAKWQILGSDSQRALAPGQRICLRCSTERWLGEG